MRHGLLGDAERLGDLGLGDAPADQVDGLPARLGASLHDTGQQVEGRLRGAGAVSVRCFHGQQLRTGLGALDGLAGQHEGRPRAGTRARGQRLVHRPGADADAPLAAAHEREHEVDDRGGVVHDALHLVSGCAFETAHHARPVREPAEQRIDPVLGPPAVALVDRQHEHAPSPIVKAQSFIR